MGAAAGVGERDIGGEGPAEIGGVDDLAVRAVHEGERGVGHFGALADLGSLQVLPFEDEQGGEMEVHGDLLARRGRGRVQEADPPGAVPGLDGLGVELELDRPRSEPGCLGAALDDGLGARAGGEAQGLGLPRRDHIGLEPLDLAAREHAHRAERTVQDEGDLSGTALLALADLDARGAQRVPRRGQRIEGHEQRIEVIHLEVATLGRGDVTALPAPVPLGGLGASALGDAAQEGEVGPLGHEADADDGDPRAAQLVGDAGGAADVLLACGNRLGRARIVGERDLRGVGLRLAEVAAALTGLARVDVVLAVAEPEDRGALAPVVGEVLPCGLQRGPVVGVVAAQITADGIDLSLERGDAPLLERGPVAGGLVVRGESCNAHVEGVAGGGGEFGQALDEELRTVHARALRIRRLQRAGLVDEQDDASRGSAGEAGAEVGEQRLLARRRGSGLGARRDEAQRERHEEGEQKTAARDAPNGGTAHPILPMMRAMRTAAATTATKLRTMASR